MTTLRAIIKRNATAGNLMNALWMETVLQKILSTKLLCQQETSQQNITTVCLKATSNTDGATTKHPSQVPNTEAKLSLPNTYGHSKKSIRYP